MERVQSGDIVVSRRSRRDASAIGTPAGRGTRTPQLPAAVEPDRRELPRPSHGPSKTRARSVARRGNGNQGRLISGLSPVSLDVLERLFFDRRPPYNRSPCGPLRTPAASPGSSASPCSQPPDRTEPSCPAHYAMAPRAGSDLGRPPRLRATTSLVGPPSSRGYALRPLSSVSAPTRNLLLVVI